MTHPAKPRSARAAALRDAASHRLGLAVLGLILATLAFAIWVALPALSLAFSGRAAAAADESDAQPDRFMSNLDTYTGRFEGRSLFFDPPPPRPEPRPIVRDEPDDRAPAPPAAYGGPRIVAMFADEVWFADGRRLRVGGEEDGSLRVVSVDSPWSADVEWRGAPFTVPFFPRDKLFGSIQPPQTVSANMDERNGN
jgi:hypothetical protein